MTYSNVLSFWTKGWTDKRTEGQTDGQTDRNTDGQTAIGMQSMRSSLSLRLISVSVHLKMYLLLFSSALYICQSSGGKLQIGRDLMYLEGICSYVVACN